MKSNKIHVPVVNVDTGEYMLLIKNKKESKANSNKFIKFYFPLINILHTFAPTELIIIQFIANNLGIKKNKILITQDLTNLKKSSYYNSINKLIKLNVIFKTKYENIYQVNNDMLYNGKY